MIDRRSLLARGALLSGALLAPRLAWAAAPTTRRLVFVIQRGAADGLATLSPTGDPAYAGLRGDLADPGGGTKLDWAVPPRSAATTTQSPSTTRSRPASATTPTRTTSQKTASTFPVARWP